MKTLLAAAIGTAFLAMPLSPGSAQTAADHNFVTVQPQGQWLVSRLIGQPVANARGERIGDINDLLFDGSGRIANVVVGVGGFLGIGEKNVAMPYSALSITTGSDGRRVIKAALSKDELKAAPAFKATEKTVYMRAKQRDRE